MPGGNPAFAEGEKETKFVKSIDSMHQVCYPIHVVKTK